MTRDALAKEEGLRRLLAEAGEAVLAFSGGVDSSYLAAVCGQVLGERISAVTVDSPTLPRSDLAAAAAFCRERGLRHIVVAGDECGQDAFVRNTARRCYACRATQLAAVRRWMAGRFPERRPALYLGAVLDDLGDHRPGMEAAREAGARFPLLEAGLTKTELRWLSRRLGLPTWDRPASPCLASRIPYHEPIDTAALARIEKAEEILRGAGFAECRVRHHRVGADRCLARIEVPPADLDRLLAQRVTIEAELLDLGYLNVALDLGGLRSGGFNRMLADSGRLVHDGAVPVPANDGAQDPDREQRKP